MNRISYTISLLCVPIAISIAQNHDPHSLFNSPVQPARSSGTFLYTLTTSSEPYADLVNPVSINNGEIWDEPEYIFPIGFPFELLEDVVDAFEFYGSGSIMRAPTSDPDVYAYIFPFETDLVDRGSFGAVSLSPISYLVEGPVGSRIFKLEFKNAGSYFEMEANGTLDMYINFQMWLFEGSNMIQFHFGPSSIDDPDLFYDGESGAGIGAADYNEVDDIATDIHFITGDAASPVLSDNQNVPFITGTPANGTVYTLSLDLPIGMDLFISPVTSYCEPNGVIEVDAFGGVPPYTYNWSNGGTMEIITDLAEGTYSITVTDQTGNTATASVVVFSLVDPMIIELESTDETGVGENDGTALVTASEGALPYTYEWSNGATTPYIEGLTPGTYSVTVTDSAGCTEVGEVIINPFGCPELLLEAGVQNTLCFGACDGNISILEVINGSAPFTYEWDNGDNGAMTDELCPGVYMVTVVDNNQCIVSGSFGITEPTAVVATAGSTNETIEGANDGTAWVLPSGGTPPYGYSWSNSSSDSLLVNLSPGTYTVSVSDAFNCVAYDSVVIEAGPCALLTGEVTDATCFGHCNGSIAIQFGGVEPATYSWSNGDTLPDISFLCAGDYMVTATDASGCSVISAFTVSQPLELSAISGSTGETITGGDGTAWIVPAGGTPPYTYEWSNGSTDSLITGLIADVYNVIITDANACRDTQDVVVEEFVCFTIIEEEIQQVFCADSCDGQIYVTIQGGVGPFTFAWSNGDTSDIVFDLCAGGYSVTVTDLGQGCSTFVDIEVTEPDSYFFTVDELFHLTDTSSAAINISVTGGTPPYFFLWFGPNLFLEFTEDIADIEPGEYILNIFDSNDCNLVDTIEILDLTTGLPVLQEGAVSIYPNPVSDFLHIDSGMPDAYTVEMFSSIGERSGSWVNADIIDVRQYVPGLFVVKFKNHLGYYVKRIVLQ